MTWPQILMALGAAAVLIVAGWMSLGVLRQNEGKKPEDEQ